MRLQTTRVWLPGLLLWIVSPALVAQEKAGDAVKVQARLGRSLRQLAGEIDKRVQGQKAMFLPLPAERETDLLTAVQGLVLQALLAESVLVVPLAEEDRKALGDDKGKLSLKSVLGSSSLEHLRKTREVKFLVVSQARERGKKVPLTVQCVDLTTARQVFKLESPLLETRDAEHVKAFQLLPPRNVKVLLHAASYLGKQVGRGECWDLPAEPLQKDGFSVRGYDFGTKVPWAEALPGDVITIDNGTQHHVMVMWRPGKEMRQAKILHQNWNKQRFVVRDQLPAHYPAADLILWRPGVRS